jgi:hypothetical protein
MPHELYSKLFADRVDPEELLEILSSHFSRAEADLQGGWFFPSREESRLHVRLKGDQVQDIAPGGAFDSEEAETLRVEIERSLVEAQADVIHTTVAFAYAPVDGYFRDPRDAFQILPAPPQAPRPPHFVGHHPFLLQHRFAKSANDLISLHRGQRESTQWVWCLNALLEHKVFTYGPRSRQLWAITPDWGTDDLEFDTKWAQEFYAIPDWQPPTILVESDAMPIVEVPASEYYGRLGLRLGEAFAIPDSLSDDVSRFLDLLPERRGRFLRAAHWKAAAGDVWEKHMSSWYIALVAVIESLAQIEEPADPCESCGRDRNQRPTKRFKDFLTRYAPGSGTRTELDVLYSVRSGLAHGGGILRHDMPMGPGMIAFGGSERRAMDRLSAAVTIAMVNWLRDPSPETGVS